MFVIFCLSSSFTPSQLVLPTRRSLLPSRKSLLKLPRKTQRYVNCVYYYFMGSCAVSYYFITQSLVLTSITFPLRSCTRYGFCRDLARERPKLRASERDRQTRSMSSSQLERLPSWTRSEPIGDNVTKKRRQNYWCLIYGLGAILFKPNNDDIVTIATFVAVFAKGSANV